MNKNEPIQLVKDLFTMHERCNLHIDVWYPSMEVLDWLLEKFVVGINLNIPTILQMYDDTKREFAHTYLSVFLHDEEVDIIREHEKLKDLYNEWFFNKQKKGDIINE
jgi:hypothetical protein